MIILKRLRRSVRDSFFLQITKQEGEELRNTVNTIFIVSLTLLCISVILTIGISFMSELAVELSTRKRLGLLDDASIISSLLMLISVFLTTAIKTGAFARYRAILSWLSFVLIVIAVVITASILLDLVFPF